MSADKYARHGGVHFTQNASAKQINEFVEQLPSEDRESLFEVMNELEQEGLINVVNDGKFADPYGKLHGTEGCYDGKDE